MYIFAQFLCFSSCQEPLVGSGNTWVSGNMWTWWVGRKRSICHRKEHESITLCLWLFLFVKQNQNEATIVVFVTEISMKVLQIDFDNQKRNITLKKLFLAAPVSSMRSCRLVGPHYLHEISIETIDFKFALHS